MPHAILPDDERTSLACLSGIAEPGDELLRRVVDARGALRTVKDLTAATPPAPAELAAEILNAETASFPSTAATTGEATDTLAQAASGCPSRDDPVEEDGQVTDPRSPILTSTRRAQGEDQIEDLTIRIRRAFTRWRACAGDLPVRRALRAAWDRRGVRFITPGQPEWPTLLDGLGPARPYGLWLRGEHNLREVCARSVALVGSRAASDYGLHVAAQLADDLTGAGFTVLAGGAYGIDAQAHRAALAAHGTTVAVLASGVDVAYPAAHVDMFAEIAANGVIVSEWPPGTHPYHRRFLARNRIIASLTCGTVIIESSTRSGSLSTARHARALGRPLMAVPGPITAETSRGCHLIIREQNAILVTTAREIIEQLHTA